MRRVLMIINPASGKAEPVLHTLNTVFRQYGVRWDALITQDAGDAEAAARAATQDSAIEMVIVYGGDGTIHDTLNGLAESETPLALIGGGTGNAIAKELNTPMNTRRAIEAVLSGQGQIQAYDVARAEDRYFLMRADMGLFARKVNPSREAKNKWGILSYFMGILSGFSQPVDVDYTVTVDGTTHTVPDAAACTVANISHTGGMGLRLGSAISPDDGLLNAIVFDNNISDLLKAAAGSLGLAEIQQLFQHFSGEEIRIETATPEPILLDGEEGWQSPITIRAIKGGIRVFVPTA